MKIKHYSLLVIGGLFLTGCQSTPRLPVPANNPPVAAVQDQPDAYRNKQVTWGGVILATDAKEKGTEITILAKSLEKSTRPIESDASQGRFIAKIDGFLDPAVYAQNREISINGSITGTVTRKIGEYDYTYPTVSVSSHHLWAVRVRYDDDYWDPWWDPWYGPWYYPYPYYYYHHHREIQEVR
ncbi:MAG: Slp family lipoprotein [Thioalkalispiraceae bacterium]|jgi:outer membrane lipoprotein